MNSKAELTMKNMKVMKKINQSGATAFFTYMRFMTFLVELPFPG